MKMTNGNLMYEWAGELFPINRSLTGDGVRQTLGFLKKLLPNLNLHSINSGTKVFDWVIPNEWNVKSAYIITPDGKKICDYSVNNLHLVGYSEPIDTVMSLDDLKKHLYSLPELPNAIPYITSYYKQTWGFCITHDELLTLQEGQYHVHIDSTLSAGVLNYADLLIRGQSEDEILLSTYICHPSMANNELSGIVVTTALAQWLSKRKNRLSYRIVFIPETIGSIMYISQNLQALKKNVKAGFVVTTIGDDNAFSYVASRYGNTLADRVILHVLKDKNYKSYSFLDRGSDERQYCAPGVDLPVATLCRSKYGEYKEYHTSLDNLDFISPQGLFGGFSHLAQAIEVLEHNEKYKIKVLCEPQLGKRGLYPQVSTKTSGLSMRKMTNFIAYADGTNDLIDIANLIDANALDLIEIKNKLLEAGLLEIVHDDTRSSS